MPMSWIGVAVGNGPGVGENGSGYVVADGVFPFSPGCEA
jgi:hypothetical protein